MNYRDLGYNNFLQRSILQSDRFSSIEARNQIPVGSVSAASIIPPMNATTDIVFSSVDNNTAQWTAGTIYFSNGSNSGTMDAGNTGNIGATTYIYYDKEQLGTLKTTTNVQQATGLSRLLIAIVEIGGTGKSCKITPIIAAGMTVTDLAANQINVNQLAALATRTGSLVVDENATVGGSGYNGTVTVKDIFDSVKVLLDRNGITINDGKITMKDQNGTTIIDRYGINSLNAFRASDSVQAPGQTITLGTFELVDDSLEISLDRSTRALFLLETKANLVETPPTDTCNGVIDIFDNGADIGGMEFRSGSTITETRMAHVLRDLSTGDHTFSVKAALTSIVGSPSMELLSYRFTFLLFGA